MSEKLDKAIETLNKRFGQGSIRKASEIVGGDFESWGIDDLDKITRGYKKGSVIEIIGENSAGKTAIALHAAREVQQKGGVVAFIDAENALNEEYATLIGFDWDKLLYVPLEHGGEQAFEVAREIVATGEVDLIIFDSVAAMIPKSELMGETGEASIGRQARMMGQGLRQITPIAAKHKCTCMFINQWRQKIGVMFGDPRVPTGGMALQYAAQQRLEVVKGAHIKDGEVVTGFRQRVKVLKSKFSPPFVSAEWDVIYGMGVDTQGSMIDLAVEFDIVSRKGSWYSYKDTKLGQGKNAVRDMLADNPELSDEIQAEINKTLGR